MTIILRNAIQTPDGTVLTSAHRWDYQSHVDNSDGKLYVVDGGKDYFRGSYHNPPHPDFKDLRVTIESPHELIREVFEWVSKLDKYGNALKAYSTKVLKDLTDDHVKALVMWTKTGYPDWVHKIILDEKEWRDL